MTITSTTPSITPFKFSAHHGPCHTLQSSTAAALRQPRALLHQSTSAVKNIITAHAIPHRQYCSCITSTTMPNNNAILAPLRRSTRGKVFVPVGMCGRQHVQHPARQVRAERRADSTWRGSEQRGTGEKYRRRRMWMCARKGTTIQKLQ